MSNLDFITEAYDLYMKLRVKISEVYSVSDEYPIFQKSPVNDLLYDTEEYIHELFTNITAKGRIKSKEKQFIEKLTTNTVGHVAVVNKDMVIESVTTSIPEYLKLAKTVDSYTQNTRYAEELFSYTEDICRLLQSVDGAIEAEELEFTNPVLENLRVYVKQK